MTGPEERPLPGGYPDVSNEGWGRLEDIDFLDLRIRMTVALGERFVQLWDLVDDHPTEWIGNAFRIDAEPPCLYLNYRYEQIIKRRAQRHELARIAAKFWKP